MSNALPTTRWNVLFFGMPCAFSSPILTALDRPDVNLVGVVSPLRGSAHEPFRIVKGPAAARPVPLGGAGRSLLAPRWLVRDVNDPRLAASLAELKPDLIVVACYPRLIPATITALADLAAINVHPSLLPRHRGPDPLFWTFQNGDAEAGVTIHLLDGDFDSGDILVQAPVSIAQEESLPALEQRLAGIGAAHISDLISALPMLPDSTRQDPSRATSESWAGGADLAVDPAWTVSRARRFIAGVARSHGPLTYVDQSGKVVEITGLATHGHGQEIACADGHLRVQTRLPQS